MQRIAQFEKVSQNQFLKDCKDAFPEMDESMIIQAYEGIHLPKRATTGSAGYDFYLPFDLKLSPKETIKIPTGIRASMNESWVLHLYPRSGLGFKFRLQLNNTVGIIDSDYYYSSNEGHIQIKITNDSNEGKIIDIKQGEGFAQGIFLQYGITVDDETSSIRDGGFGSTTKKR